MRKKALVYPYNILVASLIRHRDYIKNYEVEYVVSPKGLWLGGKDARESDQLFQTGITVTEDYEQALENCDAVIIAEYDTENVPKFYYRIMDRIKQALENRKEVFCTLKLKQESVTWLKRYADLCQAKFVYALDAVKDDLPENLDMHFVKQPETPVVCILGLSENCSKFELQMQLHRGLENMGYRVSHVGSKHYCELMGFHSFPEFMYQPYRETDKIKALNRYLLSIEEQENPDIFLVGVPGGMMPVNDKIENYFGILPVETSYAVRGDFNIVSTYYETSVKSSFDVLRDILKHRLNSPLNALCLSNISINLGSFAENSGAELEYDIVPPEMLAPVDTENRPVYRIYDSLDLQNLLHQIEEELSGNYDNQWLF